MKLIFALFLCAFVARAQQVPLPNISAQAVTVISSWQFDGDSVHVFTSDGDFTLVQGVIMRADSAWDTADSLRLYNSVTGEYLTSMPLAPEIASTAYYSIDKPLLKGEDIVGRVSGSAGSGRIYVYLFYWRLPK